MNIPVDCKSSETFFGLDVVRHIMKRHYPELKFVPPVKWGVSPRALFTSTVQKATSMLFREVKDVYEEEFHRIFNSDSNIVFVKVLREEGFRYWLKNHPLTHEYFMKTCIRYAIFTAKAYSMGITAAPSLTNLHLFDMIKGLKTVDYINAKFWETLQIYCNNFDNLFLIFICALMVFLTFFMCLTQWFPHDIYLDSWGTFVTVLSITFLSRTLYYVMQSCTVFNNNGNFIFPIDISADIKSSETFFELDVVLHIMKHHYPELKFAPPIDIEWRLSPHPLFTSDVQKATSILFRDVKYTYEEEFNRIFNANHYKVSFVNVLIEEGSRYWLKNHPLTPEFFMKTCIRYAIFTAKAYSMGIHTAPSWMHLHAAKMIQRLRKVGYITDRFWENLQNYCTDCVMAMNLFLIFIFAFVVFMTVFMYSTEWFPHDVYLDVWGIFVIVLCTKFLSRTVTLYYVLQNCALLKKGINIFMFPIDTFYPVKYIFIYCILLLSITPFLW